jgi:ribosomal protein S6--L-glutamate ligase
MILSYHPFFHGHRFRLCAGREPDERDRELMRRASAVLLPPGRLPALYALATRCCGLVFPNYASRYAYPGKIGDIRLFQKLNLPYPATDCFASLTQCPANYWSQISYPVIIKHSAGGEGRMVFVVHGLQEAREVLSNFRGMEKSGLSGFLVQDLVPTEQRTLRVVVMHTQMYSYWRIQPDENKLVHNLAQGGRIDHTSDPGLRAQGEEVVRELCRWTGINLAGIDVLFARCPGRAPQPLLLEINYFFAVRGLGGLEAYHAKLKQAVWDWLLEHKQTLPPRDFA